MTVNLNMTLEQYLESLREQRGQAHQRYIELDRRIKGLEAELGISAASEIEKPAPVASPSIKTEETFSSNGKYENLSGKTRGQAALIILKEVTGRLTAREIAERLEQRGVDMSSEHAQVVLNNALGRLLKQKVVIKAKVGGVNRWSIEKTDAARLKIEKLLNANIPTNGHKSGPVTYGDIAEATLRQAGNKMHISEIMKAVNAAGLNPSRPTLSSGLIKDSKNRFKNLGGNTFVLTEWESIPAQTELSLSLG